MAVGYKAGQMLLGLAVGNWGCGWRLRLWLRLRPKSSLKLGGGAGVGAGAGARAGVGTGMEADMGAGAATTQISRITARPLPNPRFGPKRRFEAQMILNRNGNGPPWSRFQNPENVIFAPGSRPYNSRFSFLNIYVK